MAIFHDARNMSTGSMPYASVESTIGAKYLKMKKRSSYRMPTFRPSRRNSNFNNLFVMIVSRNPRYCPFSRLF